jgi:hemerythrin
MALFDWKETYSVGVKEIDNQHKILVGTLNELFEAMRNRAAHEVIAGIVKGLTDYVGVHFSFEEGLMKKHGYPELLSHQKEHQAFVEKVTDFQGKHKAGNLMLSMEVMNFLKDWLKNHIMGTDKKYSAFFNSKGVV